MKVTLLAELFLTVHMLCTEKRLCTNPVKFLVSMLSAVLSKFRTQAESVFISHSLLSPPFLLASGGLSFDHRFLPKIDAHV